MSTVLVHQDHKIVSVAHILHVRVLAVAGVQSREIVSSCLPWPVRITDSVRWTWCSTSACRHVSPNRGVLMSAPSLWWIPVMPVLHLHRYYGLLRPLLAHPGSLRSPLTSRYRLGQRRRRGLPRSWGIPLRACPGLGLRRLVGDLASSGSRDTAFRGHNDVGIRNEKKISELNPRGPLPCVSTLHVAGRPAQVQDSLPACPLRR